MSIVILQVLILLAVLMDVVISFLWVCNYKSTGNGRYKKPFVSVLVAARNEEEHIASCLRSLLAQEYEDFEILVGNDNSTDGTAAIALKLAKNDERITVYDIREGGQTGGKANVLARLASSSAGEILFFTDADVEVPETWIASMLEGFDENTGIVTGVTGVGGERYWAKFQHLDWMIALGMVKVVSDLGFPVTALGNNMAITREAYEAVGGFDAIPFSVTEDFEILRHISARGFASTGLVTAGVYAITRPEHGTQLLQQRKRWMKGALKLPLILVILLAVQAMFFPLLLVLAVSSPAQAVLFLLLKMASRWIFVRLVSAGIEKKVPYKALIFYEIYAGVLSLMLSLFYLLPVKIKWKGREY